ncbi:MAG: hypothetical protein GXP49_10835 [Deltaproteobacteria bacterium]|nr:hypothetical protein [Deltaproteobacteria bacterium]
MRLVLRKQAEKGISLFFLTCLSLGIIFISPVTHSREPPEAEIWSIKVEGPVPGSACVMTQPDKNTIHIFRNLTPGGGKSCDLQHLYLLKEKDGDLEGKLVVRLTGCNDQTDFLFLRNVKGKLLGEDHIDIDSISMRKPAQAKADATVSTKSSLPANTSLIKGESTRSLCQQARAAISDFEQDFPVNPLQDLRNRRVSELIGLYQSHLRKKEPAQALLEILAAFKVDNYRIDLLDKIAKLALRLNKQDLAMAALRRVLIYDPENAGLTALLSGILAGNRPKGEKK